MTGRYVFSVNDLKAAIEESLAWAKEVQQPTLVAKGRLEKHLTTYGLKLKIPETPSDGSCMFHAVAAQTGDGMLDLRLRLSAFLQKNPVIQVTINITIYQ